MNVKLLLLLVSVVVVAGCSGAPVRNVNDAPVATGSLNAANPEQVRNAIVAAGASLGWSMNAAAPGLVTGRIALRGHSADVNVRYTAKSYSIVYKDSSGLEFRDGMIHKNYNGWVENLDREIRRNLLLL